MIFLLLQKFGRILAFNHSLQNLKLDYLELSLIQWPGNDAFEHAWHALEDLYIKGEFNMTEPDTGFSIINHIGITVSNLENSIIFYEALTGGKIANKDEISGKRMAETQGLENTLIKFANLHLGNVNIDILEYVEPKPSQAHYSNEQISAMHMCFEVDDIDAAVARLKAIGIHPDGKPIFFEEQDGLKNGLGTGVAYFTDPDGTNLELIAPKGPFTRG